MLRNKAKVSPKSDKARETYANYLNSKALVYIEHKRADRWFLSAIDNPDFLVLGRCARRCQLGIYRGNTMSQADDAELKAREMLAKLQEYNNKILGDDLNDSIIERINAAKELRDELHKARNMQRLARRKLIDSQSDSATE